MAETSTAEEKFAALVADAGWITLTYSRKNATRLYLKGSAVVSIEKDEHPAARDDATVIRCAGISDYPYFVAESPAQVFALLAAGRR